MKSILTAHPCVVCNRVVAVDPIRIIFLLALAWAMFTLVRQVRYFYRIMSPIRLLSRGDFDAAQSKSESLLQSYRYPLVEHSARYNIALCKHMRGELASSA